MFTINDFIKDIQEHGHRFIFFIDEMQTFLKAKINDIPLIDYFKDLLSSGKMTIIGTTTFQDIENVSYLNDESFQRRFEIVELKEFSFSDSAKVLEDSSLSFEKKFSEALRKTFTIEKSVYLTAVKSAAFYLPDESQPASAIKILEGTAVEIMKANLHKPAVEMKPIDIKNYCRKNYRSGLLKRAWKVLNNQYNMASKIVSATLSSFSALFFLFSLYNQVIRWIKPV